MIIAIISNVPMLSVVLLNVILIDPITLSFKPSVFILCFFKLTVIMPVVVVPSVVAPTKANHTYNSTHSSSRRAEHQIMPFQFHLHPEYQKASRKGCWKKHSMTF